MCIAPVSWQPASVPGESGSAQTLSRPRLPLCSAEVHGLGRWLCPLVHPPMYPFLRPRLRAPPVKGGAAPSCETPKDAGGHLAGVSQNPHKSPSLVHKAQETFGSRHQPLTPPSQAPTVASTGLLSSSACAPHRTAFGRVSLHVLLEGTVSLFIC